MLLGGQARVHHAPGTPEGLGGGEVEPVAGDSVDEGRHGRRGPKAEDGALGQAAHLARVLGDDAGRLLREPASITPTPSRMTSLAARTTSAGKESYVVWTM